MFRKFDLLGSVIIVLMASSVPSAHAKSWDVIPQEFRTTHQPAELIVHINQTEIIAGRDPADISSSSNSGGLIGAIINDAIDSALVKGARGGTDQSVNSFNGREADAAFMNGIRKGVAGVPWVRISIDEPLRDNSPAAKNTLLENSKSNLVISTDCSYNISQRFHAVWARCAIMVPSKTFAGNPKNRWDRWNLLYNHSVEAEIELANPSKAIGGRREQWMSNSGALLRTALNLAISKVGILLGRQLSLTNADLDEAKKLPIEHITDAYTSTVWWHNGPVIEGSNNLAGVAHPNAGGRLLLFKPGADGVVMLEKPDNLFFFYSITAP